MHWRGQRRDRSGSRETLPDTTRSPAQLRTSDGNGLVALTLAGWKGLTLFHSCLLKGLSATRPPVYLAGSLPPHINPLIRTVGWPVQTVRESRSELRGRLSVRPRLCRQNRALRRFARRTRRECAGWSRIS